MVDHHTYEVVTPSSVDADVEDGFLRSAVEARDLIAEAKAVLVRRHDLTPEQAFELLRHYGRSWDRPLRDVALRVVRGTWVVEV